MIDCYHIRTLLKMHLEANCAFANSVYAVFDVKSKPGRYCHKYLNPAWIWMLTEHFHYMHDSRVPPTGAAYGMIEHEIKRYKGRCISMSTLTRNAMLEYVDERITLLDAAAEAAPKYRAMLRRASKQTAEIKQAIILECCSLHPHQPTPKVPAGNF